MKNKFLGFALVVGLFGATSCKKLLEQQPGSALDASTAFVNKTTVEAGVNGVYSSLQSGSYYGLRYWALADLYTDVIRHTGTFPSFAQFANRSLLADNTEISAMWNSIYITINRANNLIAAIPGVTDPTLTNKNALLGEVRFLRGLAYFDLVRAWGGSATGYNKPGGLGVPLFLEPTLTPENAAPKPRSTEQQVYTQVESDLDFAIANLPTIERRGKANVDAALGIKARLQLYKGLNAEAEALATQVITKYSSRTSLGGLATNYSDLFLTQNVKPESIFELQFDATNTNSIAFFYVIGALGGRNEITAATTLAAQHEANDRRLPVNVSPAGSPVGTNKTLKYSRVGGTDNYIILRLAELYLIRAEARAKQGKLIGPGSATEDVNLIRARAGLAPLPVTTITQADILTAIEKENLLEFAHEGHRLFDLRRNNREDAVLSFTGANEFRALYPIPLREVQTSGGIIVQNPGTY